MQYPRIYSHRLGAAACIIAAWNKIGLLIIQRMRLASVCLDRIVRRRRLDVGLS